MIPYKNILCFVFVMGCLGFGGFFGGEGVFLFFGWVWGFRGEFVDLGFFLGGEGVGWFS